ncbi:rhomboid family intramembrane serine protease [Neorhodopirellula lusitana]|uniref:rhomboid family intramembrane serine protease n=1 Tax=Neorhodopirellula lusitana TaxID=445327 RepID=UPI00384D058B
MIPLRDDIPSHTTPLVNYLVIALCSLAFLAQQSSSDQSEGIVASYAMIPLRLTDPGVTPVIETQAQVRTPRGIEFVNVRKEMGPSAVPPWVTLITCMFLHGGWMHFLGNMWFLYIFGDNVEDRLGHFGFATLYLGTGIVAGLAHLASDPSSPIPTLGASGAIAGVMGAYAFLYPHARVLAVLPLFVFFTTFVVPAPIFLGIWFAIQIFSGISSGAGGVAWWAHAGGFAAGIIAAVIIGRLPMGHGPVVERRF